MHLGPGKRPGERSFLHAVQGAWLLIQPPETILLQALPAALFAVVASPHGALSRALRLFLAVIAVYGSIGALNDYCDLDLDSTSKPFKPLVRGLVTTRFALWQALILGIAGMWLSIALNWTTAGFSAFILVLGIWYDFQAKRSILSWVPYVLGIPTLPLWGFAAAGKFEPRLLLAYPLGALLSLALNMGNTLPDREKDAAFGLRALTHRLSLRAAVALMWVLYAGAIASFAAAAPVLHNNWSILTPGLGAGVVVLLLMIADYLIFRTQGSLRRNWFAGGFLAVVTGLAWVASLPRK